MSSKPAPAGKEIETVATRPIETDPRDQKTATASRNRSAAWIGVAAALALAVGAFFVGKGAGLGSPTDPTATTSTTKTTSTALTTASTATTSATANSTGTATGTGTPNATATAPPTVERAMVTLLGDGTRVSVDGVGRGTAPARVTVEPGTHAFLFSFPTTGESKGESLTVKPGERVTLRADFTKATPTIRVER
jgi:hypothetical protein